MDNMEDRLLSDDSARDELASIEIELGECVRCELHETRKSIVFGEGNPDAGIMFVGEAPGADEDLQGKPFVGRAGKALTQLLGTVGIDRKDVYIANIVKCRPPANRQPKSSEIAMCVPFLEAQIRAVNPRILVALGRVSTGILLGTSEPLSKVRGKVHDRLGTPLMATFHPSFLLRNGLKGKWMDEALSHLKEATALAHLTQTEVGHKKSRD
jgi:uracil-DNA glycosylase